MIRLYVKIPEEFVYLIIQDRCCVLLIPLVHMVKFKFLTEFPVDHLCQTSLSAFICYIRLFCDWSFFLCLYITRQMLFCCVSSILALIWMVFMALFRSAIRRDWVSLSKFPFLCHILVFLCEISFVSRFKTSIELFSFPCLFSGEFCFVRPRFVSIVSSGCNQFSSLLFNEVFKLFYRCISIVFNAGKSCASFFSRHTESVNFIYRMWMPYAWSLIFVFPDPFV